jgi:hypothetical protein
VVKHVDVVELRLVVAAVLAVAADAVLVAQHLLKLGAHLVSALARLHVRNLARRSRLPGGGEHAVKKVRKFGTGNRKYRWHARVYPEVQNFVFSPAAKSTKSPTGV